MFDKVQESLKKSKDERQKKRLEKERVRLEKAAAEAVREKEWLQQEAEKIQAEKERLLSLDDKGLMVELILAVRGLYSQMEYIHSTAVTAAPVSNPATGFAVHRASRLRRRLPAPCCTALHRLSVPYKNNANPPNTCNNTWNPCSIRALRFCLSFIFMQREPVCALTKPTSFL